MARQMDIHKSLRLTESPSHLKPGYRFLIRCDGSHEIGLGHVSRCLALAQQVRLSLGVDVIFAVWEGKAAINMIKAKGYETFEHCEACAELTKSDWLTKLILELRIDALIVDIRRDGEEDALLIAKEHGIVVTGIDDLSHRVKIYDLSFVPPVPQVSKVKNSELAGILLSGWEWIILDERFSSFKKVAVDKKSRNNSALRLLVTMGGTDPFRLTEKCLDALRIVRSVLDVDVVLGSGFEGKKHIYEMCENLHHRVVIMESVDNMAEVMHNCDVAIASFGTTAYEMACVGLPAVYLAISEDHAMSASVLEKKGICLNLGMYSDNDIYSISNAIKLLVANHSLRRQMHLCAEGLIDGKGAVRIGERILDRIRQKANS